MTTLQLSKVTLNFLIANDEEVFFLAENDEPPLWFRRLEIDRGTYEDMGCPEVITVTIEPGDKLNNE